MIKYMLNPIRPQAKDKTLVNSISWAGYPFTWSATCPIPVPSGNKTYAQGQFCAQGSTLYSATGKPLGLSGATCGGDSGGPILVTVQPNFTAQYPTATQSDALSIGWRECGWNSTTNTVVSTGCDTGGMIGTLIGIVSYGPTACGTGPGVYTRVSAYAGWIQDQIRRRGSVAVPIQFTTTVSDVRSFETTILRNAVRSALRADWAYSMPFDSIGDVTLSFNVTILGVNAARAADFKTSGALAPLNAKSASVTVIAGPSTQITPTVSVPSAIVSVTAIVSNLSLAMKLVPSIVPATTSVYGGNVAMSAIAILGTPTLSVTVIVGGMTDLSTSELGLVRAAVAGSVGTPYAGPAYAQPNSGPLLAGAKASPPPPLPILPPPSPSPKPPPPSPSPPPYPIAAQSPPSPPPSPEQPSPRPPSPQAPQGYVLLSRLLSSISHILKSIPPQAVPAKPAAAAAAHAAASAAAHAAVASPAASATSGYVSFTEYVVKHGSDLMRATQGLLPR